VDDAWFAIDSTFAVVEAEHVMPSGWAVREVQADRRVAPVLDPKPARNQACPGAPSREIFGAMARAQSALNSSNTTSADSPRRSPTTPATPFRDPMESTCVLLRNNATPRYLSPVQTSVIECVYCYPR
jgi:hypothetical protein